MWRSPRTRARCRRSRVTPPGGDKSGAILLIDASNSMKGAPIQNAMAASRAFLAERKKDLPVAIIVFGPSDSVLSDFTTDGAALQQAVAQTPATAEGTHIYDALVNAVNKAKDQGLERTTVVLLSDGTDVGSDASRAEALQAATDANVRVISVGLSSPQYDPATLKSLANRTGGRYVETATPGRARSRSSRRSGSSSRASTRSPTARSSRHSRRRTYRSRSPAMRRRRRRTSRPSSISHRQAPSSAAGSTRSSPRPG